MNPKLETQNPKLKSLFPLSPFPFLTLLLAILTLSDIANIKAIAAAYSYRATTAVNAGDVVVWDSAAPYGVRATATDSSSTVAGVAAETVSAGTDCVIRQDGGRVAVNVTGAVTKGQWLVTSNVTGKARGVSALQAGIFARAVTDSGVPSPGQVYASVNLGFLGYGTSGGGSSSFDGLTDVAITGPGYGHVPVYNVGGEDWRNRQIGWRDVRDYGAVADDSLDDSAAFQAALDQGGTIFIPEGRFDLGAQLAVTQNGTRLVGASMETSVINITGAFVGIHASDKRRCSIENLKITGATATGGVYLNYGANWLFKNVWVNDLNGAAGVALHFCDPSHVAVENVLVNGSPNAVGLKIESNTYNTGVMSVIGSAFGTSRTLKTGMEITNTANVIDSLSFAGSYFGGTDYAVLIDGLANRGIDFRGCHFENYTASRPIIEVDDAAQMLIIENCDLVGGGNAQYGIYFDRVGGTLRGVKLGNLTFNNLSAAGACVRVDNAGTNIDNYFTGPLRALTTSPTLIDDAGSVFGFYAAMTGSPYDGGAVSKLAYTAEGTGGGLDADTVDGSHASAFANVSGDSYTGTHDFSSATVVGIRNVFVPFGGWDAVPVTNLGVIDYRQGLSGEIRYGSRVHLTSAGSTASETDLLVPIPSWFDGSFPASANLYVMIYRSDADADGSVTLTAYNRAGTADAGVNGVDVEPTANTTWETKSFTLSGSGYTSGETIRLKFSHTLVDQNDAHWIGPGYVKFD
jgi:hypothetical protein